MKKFIISVLCVAVFFIGLGGLVEKTTANLKSDERAVEVIRRARIAIGGEAAIANVRSMTINGNVTKTLDLEGVSRTEQGDLEINFELPNRLSKMLKIGKGDGAETAVFDKQIDVVIAGKTADGEKSVQTIDGANGEKRVLVFKKGDGDTMPNEKAVNGEARKIVVNKDVRVGSGETGRENELFRTTLALLLTAPEGLDVSYVYAGEATIDGSSCDVVEARSNGSAIKLYIDKSSSLPRMMSFQGAKPLVIKINREDALKTQANGENKVFVRQAGVPTETAEFQVKFADYRSVGGLQLPHRWTQTIAGNADESVEINSFEINPSNIAEKFTSKPMTIRVKTAKPQ